MIYVPNIILGAGISGLAAGIHLNEREEDYVIIEQEDYVGGLCSSFDIQGFTFDWFIHLSFTKNDFVRQYFDHNIEINALIPNPFNYYHGIWVKHPAQNNLFPLGIDEKRKILKDLEKRNKYKDVYTENYENWLRYQFGDYFAEHFPLAYTRKYWCEDAKNMGTEWVGNRIYQPTINEIKYGVKTQDTPITYYAKEMRYPVEGGYGKFVNNCVDLSKVRLKEKVISVDTNVLTVKTDKNEYCYGKLYSSIPLPQMLNIIKPTHYNSTIKPDEIAKNLHFTSGYIISLGIRGQIPRNDLWDYIYDDDILVSRYYSPSLMSAKSAPSGCYSIQAEIYTKDGKRHELSKEKLLEKTIGQLTELGAISIGDEILVKDIKFRKYCNVIFELNVGFYREKALIFLRDNGIIPIGRFGTWDYLWSDQSFMSGYGSIID